MDSEVRPLRIRELDPVTVDQIAAGEILERPAQLLKELMENSLDAHSTSLAVELEQGGRRLRLRDNGHGIWPEDLPLVFKRFTTSKLQSLQDLESISSFGFRGEALASLASVAKVRLCSRHRERDDGFEIRAEFGRWEEAQKMAMEPGTEIFVDQLFQSVPARLKFLKSDAAEIQQCKAVFRALAMAHPECAFSLKVQGELVELLPVTDAATRVESVLGVKNLFFAQEEVDGIRLRAYFSAPEMRQKTARNLWFFVNQRWIQDRTVMAAVMEGYRNLLMVGDYPSVALFIETQAGLVDVNVHPQKNQVKFQDSGLVFRRVKDLLQKNLARAPWKNHSAAAAMPVTPSFQNFPQEVVFYKKALPQMPQKTVSEKVLVHAELPQTEPSPRRGYWSQRDLVGQVNLTYLALQDGERLSLVDQHAAHERILFERWVKQYESGKLSVQNFLFPLVLDMSQEALEMLLKHRAELQKAGIEIDAMGPASLGVQSAPELMKDSAVGDALMKMAEDLVACGGSGAFEHRIRDLFASLACHSAIRAGQSLSSAEMQALLLQMDESPQSDHCPHGRPVEVQLSWSEIERKFGRTQ